MKKVIVVGAGIPGLAAAIRLQKAGYQVSVYEKNSLPGGKTASVQKQDYSFILGPSFITLPQTIEGLFADAGKNMADYITLTPLAPMFKGVTGQKEYPFFSDLAQLNPVLQNLSPKAFKGFMAYLGHTHQRYSQIKDKLLFKTFARPRDFYRFSTLKAAVPTLFFSNARGRLQRYIPDPQLVNMLSFYSLFESHNQLNGPSYFSFFPMLAFCYGLWDIKGGNAALVKALEKLFIDLGGKVFYHSPVEKILIENQRAYGIQLGDQLALSDFVICNVDFSYAMKHLIQTPSVRGPYTSEKLESMAYSPSCLIFSFDASHQNSQQAAHQFFISEAFEKNLEQLASGEMMEDPSFHLFIHQGKHSGAATTLEITMPVSNLSVSKYGWEEETVAQYRKKILTTLSKTKGFENITSQITNQRVFTPLDFQSTSNAYSGACFGLMTTLSQSMHLRPQSKSPHCEGLYFLGNSIHPGPGLPFLLEGARLAAQDIISS